MGENTQLLTHQARPAPFSLVSTPRAKYQDSTCSDPACGGTGNATTNQSFVRSTNGNYTFFNPPGATSSQTSTVNPSGAVVGNFTINGTSTCFTECQGYLLFQGKYTTINFPGFTFTFAGGGNPPERRRRDLHRYFRYRHGFSVQQRQLHVVRLPRGQCSLKQQG